VIIFISFHKDWSANPVIVALDSLNYPNENIPFPTISICDKENQPNIYRLASKVLNHVEYLCFDDDENR